MTGESLPEQVAGNTAEAQPPVQAAPVEDKQAQQPDIAELVKNVVSNVVKEKLTEWNREQQSLRAKSNNRAKKMIDEQFETLKASNITLTDTQASDLRERILNRVLDEQEDQPAQTQGQPMPQSTVRDVFGQINAIQSKAGVWITPEDPEYFNLDDSNPQNFINTMYQAIEAKKVRTTSKATGNPAAVQAITAQGTTPNNLEAQYRKEFEALPQGDVNAIIALKQKFLALGYQT